MVMVSNDSAPRGKATKYALVERERRFLLAARPSMSEVRRVVITDRYFTGTRLRIREMIESSGNPERVVYKLTQKVPDTGGRPGLITSMYLNRAEYRQLSSLPGNVLRKVRHSMPPLGVDVFEGVLSGLYLAEAEFETDEQLAAFSPPSFVVAEVTDDRRFTGGSLVVASRADLAGALADYGLQLEDRTGR
jgi:CYTH domain-containing protein